VAARKTQRAKARGAPRCCYSENGQQCLRNGTGNPPLCRAHHLVLEDMYTRAQGGPGGSVGQLFHDFFRGNPIRPEVAAAALGEIFGFTGFPGQTPRPHGARAPGGPGVGRGGWIPGGAPRQPPRPPPIDPQVAERRRALAMARQELGFGPQEPLTPEMVGRRRKEMARRYHPDQGGSVERMARINQAADLLLETGNLG